MSTDMVPNGLNKPLPSIPTEELAELDFETPMHGISAYSLKSKTDHVDAAQKADFTDSKTVMSSPVPQKFSYGATTIVTTGKPFHTEAVQEIPKSNAYTTTADAADLGKKLSLLMREPTAENSRLAKTMEPSKPSAKQGKHSYLRRGRRVYAGAKQVITNHLGSSGERKGRGNEKNLPSSSPDTIAGPEYMTDPVINRERLDRRIAEGANLSNPKIRFLTGVGTVPRKPLPVYDSMKLLPNQYRSTSLEDPFSDDRDGNTDISSPEFDDFGFDGGFNGSKTRRARPASVIEPLRSTAQLKEICSRQSGKETQPRHQFSEAISGLAQHPDTDLFSSSPVKCSTPRYRLQVHYDASGKKRLSTIPASSPSVLDLSFEDQSGHESLDLPEANMGRSTVSLKRKTAKDDLCVNSPPVVKRAKKEDGGLTAEMAKLNAHVPCNDGLLTVKDKNKAMGKSKIPGVKGRGLKVFDVCKGKAPIPRGIMDIKRTQTGFSGKRSSIPTPIKAPNYHERRASTLVRGDMIDEDSMSLDELQMD